MCRRPVCEQTSPTVWVVELGDKSKRAAAMKTLSGWIVAIGLLALGAGPANATTITETINFTAHNFSELGGGSTVPPVDPVMGSFTITLDPAVDTSSRHHHYVQ